jgi:hypothetical protein
MARFVLAAFVGLLLSTATPFAQSTLAGNWDLDINGPQGAITAGCTFKVDGDKVTGTLSSPQGEVAVAGTMAGNTLSLSFNVDTPQGALEIKMNAEVAGDTMKGVMDISGMGTADFTGKKK